MTEEKKRARKSYENQKNVSDALQQIREEITMTPEIEYIVSFIENSERGIIR